MMAEATISMTLIWWDRTILSACLVNSMAVPSGFTEGKMAPAGRLMGYGQMPGGSPSAWISLNLTSPQDNYPWRFRTCYLAQRPVEYPLGTKAAAVVLNWRAIPYGQTDGLQSKEILSKNAILWDHGADTA